MIIGVDIGVRRLAIASPTAIWATSLDLGTKPGVRHIELGDLSEWLWMTLMTLGEAGQMDLVVEQPMLTHDSGVFESMSHTIGAVLSADTWHSALVVHPSTWKSQLLGYGNADKADHEEWLYVNSPTLYNACDTEDEYDAMCIGLFGELLEDGLVEIPERKPRKRAAKKTTPAAE